MNLRLLKAGYVTSYRHQSGDVRAGSRGMKEPGL